MEIVCSFRTPDPPTRLYNVTVQKITISRTIFCHSIVGTEKQFVFCEKGTETF
jgi:hypothetical protein